MQSSEIRQKALQLGCSACGIIPVSAIFEYSKHLDERIELFPESKELYSPLYELASPPTAVKSIIVCTQRFNRYRVPDALTGLLGKIYMFDNRVEYSHEHRVKTEFEKYLKIHGLNIIKHNVPARLAAAKAGVGKIGRNNFIYDEEHGSNVWIDAWAVDIEMEYDTVEEDVFLSACNDDCQKCIRSCPTGALTGSLSMDRARCVTQLVCFSDEMPEENIRSLMGRWIYGCDACQDACPVNNEKYSESEEFPLLNEYEEYLQPENILDMDEETYLNIINPRFWYAGKDRLWLWKCNALRSMINSNEEKYHSIIKECCNHTDVRISELARWGCERTGI
jgi:epoxyqueuosine reductase